MKGFGSKKKDGLLKDWPRKDLNLRSFSNRCKPNSSTLRNNTFVCFPVPSKRPNFSNHVSCCVIQKTPLLSQATNPTFLRLRSSNEERPTIWRSRGDNCKWSSLVGPFESAWRGEGGSRGGFVFSAWCFCVVLGDGLGWRTVLGKVCWYV